MWSELRASITYLTFGVNMAAVNVLNVMVLDNPAPFCSPLKFEITFECVQPLAGDLEWKVVYVGSAKSEQFDQELESVLVGPVPQGMSRFILETPAPDIAKIPEDDQLGATVVMVTCLYREKQFARVGYWVANSYTETLAEGKLRAGTYRGISSVYHSLSTMCAGESPPKPCPTEKIQRNILADKPTVTKWPISWV